ncbi:unnamed protein product [Closterium sp. Naga37s-1]|nr:unnamed protein product [Closterium sp. Naga37s-1]
MLLRFRPFKGRSYVHLQDQNLSLLFKVPESDIVHIESPDNETTQPHDDSRSSESSETVTPSIDYRSAASASVDSPSTSLPPPIATPTSLFDAIAVPLRAGLDAVHRDMQFAAEPQLRRSTLDRCKLVVRLGKLLFGPPFEAPGDLLPNLPPFTAGALESVFNRLPGSTSSFNRAGSTAQRLPARVHRSLETGMPEPLFQAVENIATEVDGASTCMREAYHIRVTDTDQMDLEYKLTCKPNPDGTGVILVKVKYETLRYAVIDVSRPSKEIDFRLVLSTETRLCSLDEATRSVCESIASTAIIEDNSKGGLHWPITLDFHVGMTEARSSPHAPAPSHRFSVTSVRHQRRLHVQTGGQVWKLSRVNGVQFNHGGGRLTNEAEFSLLAWRDAMKFNAEASAGMAASTPPSSLPSKPPPTSYSAESCFDSSLQQAAPQWTPDSILADCPALLAWLEQHLP